MKTKLLYFTLIIILFCAQSIKSQTTLQVKAFIEGLYVGNGKMISATNAANPSITSQIADTVNFELHAINPTNSNPYYASSFTFKSFLDTSGIANLVLPSNTIGNSYYLVIKHRNSIETWSASPILINSTANYYDFSSSSNKAYGSNLKNKNVGIYVIYSGDINQDGSVDFNDYPSLDFASNNGDLGYYSTDINGDASVDFNDYPILDLNSNLGVIKSTPSLILNIGDSYGGGIVAYIFLPGDAGHVYGQTHGLIVAPFDFNAEWGCSGTKMPYTSMSQGSGNTNTALICASCSQVNIAASICNNLYLNGYSDWFLPSLDELFLIYQNLKMNGLGNFANQWYWTSTENYTHSAWALSFFQGNSTVITKISSLQVRPARNF